MNYTYILECGDKSLYTGWTNDLEKRVKAHQQGMGGKYTRSHLPVELVYYETFATKEEAMKRECAIKHMCRAEKMKLIAAGGNVMLQEVTMLEKKVVNYNEKDAR